MLAEQFADANIASRKFSKTQRNNPSHPSETIMTKKLSIHHTSKRSALFLATAAAALLATTQFSEAKKPDPAVTSAVASASTTDIEEIVEIGISIGNQIATGAIKLSTTNVNALVRGLADAVIAKSSNPSDPNDVNRFANKVDEIAEIAAGTFDALAQSVKIKSDKHGIGQAKKYAIATIKSALKTAIKTSEFVSSQIVFDVVASVALTIHNDAKFDIYESQLQKVLTKSSKKLAGSSNKATVASALTAGFLGDANATTHYEDGTLRATLMQVADPETDLRPI